MKGATELELRASPESTPAVVHGVGPNANASAGNNQTHVTSLNRSSLRRLFIAPIIAIVLLPAAGLGAYLGGLQLVGNIHTIEPGSAYRSAQLSRMQLETVIKQHNIRSIISLVGPAPDRRWYRDELAVTADQNLARYELALSANEELTEGQLQQLLTFLQNAPKPVLIHCKNGADRSGLAAAIYKYAIAARPIEEAEGQLSLRYGHFPYLWSETGAMDVSFRRFLAEHPRGSTKSVDHQSNPLALR
jgi:protein tyrosine phosphatase (PTP) superfamily phosphohydrolase (DUF442 family)